MSSTPKTPEQLAREEQDLRISKLQLEVDDMSTPPFKKVSTWTGVGAILLAVLGLVFQGITNHYASAEAKLENKMLEMDKEELQRKKSEATKELGNVAIELKRKKDSLNNLIAQMQVQQANIDTASMKLNKLTGLVAKLSTATTNSRQQTQDEIKVITTEIRETRQELLTEVQSSPVTRKDTVAKTSENNTDNKTKVYPDDPQKGKWGMKAEQNGRKLVVEYRKWVGKFYSVTLRVISTNPLRPLTGKVIFHLHDTFTKRNPTITIENGEAVLKLKSYGAFTVGAEADGGKTILEFDMAEDPTAPDDFKKR